MPSGSEVALAVLATASLGLLVVLAFLPEPDAKPESVERLHNSRVVKSRVPAVEFRPTARWQTVRDDHVLPPGLQIRVNVSTGAKEARLLGADDYDGAVSAAAASVLLVLVLVLLVVVVVVVAAAATAAAATAAAAAADELAGCRWRRDREGRAAAHRFGGRAPRCRS